MVSGLLLIAAVLSNPADNAPTVSLVHDVIPVLTKAGCNSGKCHGSFQGRGRFRLSLLGFDAAADYEVIAKQDRGRRVFPAAPEQSLLLLKATATIPHGGGKRFDVDSPAYRILRDYIAQGVPSPDSTMPSVANLSLEPGTLSLAIGQSVPVRVWATWRDGSKRDVTQWALLDSADERIVELTPEGTVTALQSGKSGVIGRFLGQSATVTVTVPFGPAKGVSDFPRRNFIDELVAADWQVMGVEPSGLATDAEFLRRVFLDLIGTLPTVDESRRFLDDPDADKRRKIIDELLGRPEYVDYWTWKWSDVLRVHRRYLGDRGLESFSGWIRQAVRENRPLDAVVRELLTAQGNLFTSGPVAMYFIDEKPEELAETTAQVFLGIRLQCARCHHHPFEIWGQEDYRGLAAFFTQLETKSLDPSGRFGGARLLRAIDKPSSNRRIVGDPQPRLLGEPIAEANRNGATDRTPDVSAGPSDIRQKLAGWITAPDNPYFARNLANRYWKHLMGRGIVEPVDDIRISNPPSHPQLLDALARELIERHFDAKHLLATICNSSVYQRAMEVAPTRDTDGALFTHRSPRRLPAEVLLDGINAVTGVAESFPGLPRGTRAIALPDPTIDSSFLVTFGRPDRSNACECARPAHPDLSQTLHLINNPLFHAKLTSNDGRLAKLLAANRTDKEIAEEFYLSALSRRPTTEEEATLISLLSATPVRREGWEDLLWALLNSAEFVFNH